jgi:tetratricopeptide (TPR) repeat protein
MPEYVVALGDLYTVSGRTDLADEQYALARAERELFRANGVNVDLELALFDADHGSPRRALVAARAEWSRRRSVHVADALAWALHANGRDAEALRYSRLSLRLGTRDASFLYHAALIHHALGNAAEARDLLAEALAIDPHFSYLHAAEAADLLERLRGSS